MITIGLLIVTVLISYQALQAPGLMNRLCHHPYSEAQSGQYERLLTAGFVHGSWGHLFINMFVLYQFGGMIEDLFTSIFGTLLGNILFILFYLSAIVFANVGTFIRYKDYSGFSSVGASGVTSALLFIYALFAPWEMFIFPPVPAIVFAILYVIYSSWASKNTNDRIDHMAHLWGGLYGVILLFIKMVILPRNVL